MNINLDNYESFFLMYVDNELSAADRKNVEEFLGQHPYLQAELEQLKDTVLPIEKTPFAFKEGLLKTVISEESMEEYLLLHLDNELAGNAKQELEVSLLTDARLQQEWALLKRAKLDPREAIVFPDKNSLYRKEEGRLVIGKFVRWAVAAALIAGGFFIGIEFLINNQAGTSTEMAGNKNKKTGTGVVENTNTGLANETRVPGKTGQEELTGKLKENVFANNTANEEKETQENKTKKVAPVKQPDLAVNNSKKQVKENVVKENVSTPETVQPVLRNQDIARINKPAMSEEEQGTTIIAAKRTPGMLSDTNIQPIENLFAKNASFEAEEDYNDNHIFMMDEEKVSRTKAAGFLKKIKRTVERTTKIKTGNSLRIAGFEFAVK